LDNSPEFLEFNQQLITTLDAFSSILKPEKIVLELFTRMLCLGVIAVSSKEALLPYFNDFLQVSKQIL
jgi:hypothetical protein